ncbi:YaeQ family protein [Congregibacter brevis]|uniref:YaeQ family protein n=1 Tax=Congregibacter brevis TaxID=3081201 RepID=A0ABZ0I839_9GAMM|nr:YaeQ family protein [Congregibacter sp. IMCC45268]
MAIKATVFKIKLNVADLGRHVYEDFSLSVARHPSETDTRMMLRVAAFAMHAHKDLQFGRGISTDDEPDLWLKDLTDSIELWIELGTPDPDRLRKASGRSREVVLYAYGERALKVWWQKHESALARFENLSVYSVNDDELAALGALTSPNLALQCTISEEELLFSCEGHSVQLKPVALRRKGE